MRRLRPLSASERDQMSPATCILRRAKEDFKSNYST